MLDSNLNAFYMKPSDDIVSLETILKLNATKINVFADDLFSNCLLPIFFTSHEHFCSHERQEYFFQNKITSFYFLLVCPCYLWLIVSPHLIDLFFTDIFVTTTSQIFFSDLFSLHTSWGIKVQCKF